MSATLHTPIRVFTIADPDADTSYLEQEGFEERREAYERGEFGYVAVRATCEILVNGIIETIDSPGLWGIEDDSSPDYLDEIADDERQILVGVLRELGVNV